MQLYQKVFYSLTCVFFTLLKGALMIIGFLVVDIALQFNQWPRIFWLWGNQEHPLSPMVGISDYWWLAIRNPVNNHRFFLDDPQDFNSSGNWIEDAMEPTDLIKAKKNVARQWRWVGWKAGYRRVSLQGSQKYTEFWIGWKLGSVVPGLGFTVQWRRNREIGQ